MRASGGWLLAVLWITIAACAPRRTARPAEPTPPPSQAPATAAEEGGLQETPPLEQRSEPVIIFEEEPTPPVPPAQEPASAPSEAVRIPTFRVQVFAASSREKAELIAQELREIQQEPVVVVEENGLFKVQVGAFASRLLAEGYRDFLRTKGYPDAFIVQVQP